MMILNSDYNILEVKAQTFPFFQMKNQQKPASFISKLYNILKVSNFIKKSKQHCKAIIWDSQLKGIRIVNQRKLQQTVLPRYYRHNRFASFVRQLNMYDFHKIHLGDHKSIFSHETFNPKNKESIYIIRRKVTFSVEDKQSSSEEKNGETERIKNSIRSLISSEKENFFSRGSSFSLVKNSLRILGDGRGQKNEEMSTITDQQAIQQLLQQIVPLNLSQEQTRIKVRRFQKRSIYKKFLKNKQFKQALYQRLGIEFDGQKDNLSQLSIEGELLIQTRKTISQRSLRMFESGPINFRDTVGCLMGL